MEIHNQKRRKIRSDKGAKMNLKEDIQNIQSRRDLVVFLHELLKNLREKPEDWENSTLESYLEAMGAWLEDCDGYYANQELPIPQQPSWQTLGEILLASKHYE
jgi:hypothetical protein